MRFYIDTSVFGGYFDDEFDADTKKLFGEVDSGTIHLVSSVVTLSEISNAPIHVKELIQSYAARIEILELNKEVGLLSEFYVKEGALTRKFIADAQHIAFATMARVDALISWNFKHMVNFFRIRQYNSVNLRHGYPVIDIRSPREVLL